MTNTSICPFCSEEIEKDTEKCPHCGEILIKICPYCGEKIKVSAIKCKHCGEFLNTNRKIEATNSKELPDELKKFNWGAFCLGWIWGIGNKSYITLCIIISGVFVAIPVLQIIAGLIFQIWFGIKGNEWAWKNKSWKDIEHFNKVQKKWAVWGGILYGISILITIIALIAASEG